MILGRIRRITGSFLVLIALPSCVVQLESGGGGNLAPTDGGTEPMVDGGAPTPGPDAGPTPVPPQPLRVLAGGDNTCVISAAGHVACWGDAEVGQLGLGDFVERHTPTWIPGLDGVVDLAVGDGAMCARRVDGSIWCWGMNFYGELGVDTEDCPGLTYPCGTIPMATGVTGASSIAAGNHHFCAVLEPGGNLHCWGSPPWWDGAGYHALSAASGHNHTCIRFEPGPGEDPTRNVACFGGNAVGQLGTGADENAEGIPIASGVTGGFVQLAAAMDFTCGVSAASELFCWGQNVFGALGVGVSPESDFPDYCLDNGACARLPVHVTGLPAVARVEAHFAQTCALTTGGDVYCWGFASHTSPSSADSCTAIVDSTCVPTPALVPGIAHATSLGVGSGHACVVTASGEIRCWGLDTHGQLGRGEGAMFETTPVTVQLPPEPM